MVKKTATQIWNLITAFQELAFQIVKNSLNNAWAALTIKLLSYELPSHIMNIAYYRAHISKGMQTTNWISDN